jgi:hypothetical protein
MSSCSCDLGSNIDESVPSNDPLHAINDILIFIALLHIFIWIIRKS